MSKEGSTYLSPIKSYTEGDGSTYLKGMVEKVYSEQKPGTFFKDAGHYGAGYDFNPVIWYCTKYKTKELEPVWVSYTTAGGGAPHATDQYAIFVKVGKFGTDIIETKQTNGKIRKVSLEALNGRYGYRDAYSLQKSFQWGAYVFIGLSKANIAYVTKSMTTPNAGTLDTSGLVTDATTAVTTTNTANSAATNGRAGNGETQTETPATIARGGESGMNYAETMASRAGWANYSSYLNSQGSGAGGASGPSGPSTPGSKSPKNKSGKKTTSSKDTSTGLTTVTIKKLPEKIYSNAVNFVNTHPYIEQSVEIPGPPNKDGVTEMQKITRRHIFDIIPNSFEFTNLSSAWEEVPRSGNFNMVDWSKYNLTKVGFKFLLHGRRQDSFSYGLRNGSVLSWDPNDPRGREKALANEAIQKAKPPITTVVNDGFGISIDDQIENIRKMAGAPVPVRLYNLNTLLTNEFRYPYETPGKGILWVIGDLSITASRLTANAKNIAVAEVTISLIEYPEIGREIIYLPPLVPTQPVPKCKGAKCKTTTSLDLGLQVEGTYAYVPKGSFEVPSPTQPDA